MAAYERISIWMGRFGAAILLPGFVPVAAADTQPAPILYADNVSTRSQFMGSAAHLNLAEPMPAVQAVTDQARQARIKFHYPDSSGLKTLSKTLPSAETVIQPAMVSPSLASMPKASAPLDLLIKGKDRIQETVLSENVLLHKPLRVASLTPRPLEALQSRGTISHVSARPDVSLSHQTGQAVIYSDGFDGYPTANGETFFEAAMSGAHRTLPMPSLVLVTNTDNQKEIVVRVNDRGLFDGDHILELSPRAGEVLGISRGQSAPIRLSYLGEAPVKNHNIKHDDAKAHNVITHDIRSPDHNRPDHASKAVESEIMAPVQAETLQPVQTKKTLSSADQQIVPGVYVQLGSFSEIANARRLSQKLAPRQDVRIEPARIGGNDFFRVMLGPFSHRSEAEFHRQTLIHEGLKDGFITSR